MSNPETPFLDEGESKITPVEPEQGIPRRSPAIPTEDSVEAGAAPPPDVVSVEREWEFFQNEQRYLSDYIRFADQKAGFTLTFSLATLGFLFSHTQYASAFANVISWTTNSPHCAIAAVLLLASCALSLFALVPRLWSHETKGLIFWQEVAAYDSPSGYLSALRQCSRLDLNAALAQQCYSLAKICTRKYSAIRYALLAAPIGAAIGVLTVTQ